MPLRLPGNFCATVQTPAKRYVLSQRRLQNPFAVWTRNCKQATNTKPSERSPLKNNTRLDKSRSKRSDMCNTLSVGAKHSWFQTYTGIAFYPFDPKPEQIKIADIAHHLSMLCRFNGACQEFYSVAQHSVLVSEIVPWRYALQALLHDASEAYLSDIVSPVKRYLDTYPQVEQNVQRVILRKFDCGWPLHREVEIADQIAFATEARDLIRHQPESWGVCALPLKQRVRGMRPADAEDLFLRRYRLLTNRTTG